jgi:hypothetical protein
MATNKDKNRVMENLKGNFVIDFQAFEDSKHDEVQRFNKQFARDWNADHEKVQKQMIEKIRIIHQIGDEFLEQVGVDDKLKYKHNWFIQIVIGKEKEEAAE